MSTVTLTLALLGQLVFLVWAVLVSARRTIHTKGFIAGIFRGGLLLYGLVILGSFLFSVAIPTALISVGADKHVIINSFPEEIGNMPVIVFGWFPAFVVAGVVRLACDTARVACARKPPRPPALF